MVKVWENTGELQAKQKIKNKTSLIGRLVVSGLTILLNFKSKGFEEKCVLILDI